MVEVFPQETITALATDFVARIVATLQQSFQNQTRQQAKPQARLMTAKQAAEYIGRSEQAVRHLIFQRDIPVVRNGRCVRIDRKDLDTWIENNKS